MTVNVSAVLPEFPSGWAASAAAIAKATSSLSIVPMAAAVVIWASPEALESVMENPSSGSIVVSPLTFTVIVWLVSPAAKLIWPPGRVPPKSAALAGLAPVPATA